MLTLTILGGLALLFIGGELLVRGAVLMALRLGVSTLVVGLTVVGFGTSTPELVTSLQAALAGAPGIAIGNIVGSNIANVLLILGLAALVCPIPCPVNTVMRDGGLMLGAALTLAALSFGGVLGRVDGLILILGLGLYLWLLWRQESEADADPSPLQKEDMELLQQEIVAPKANFFGLAGEVGLLIVGIGATVLGGRLLVDGAIELAEIAGVSDTIIGLTIVAVGTSLPELATSMVAAVRRHSDLAYGNIVGSNVFNVLGIAGVTAFTVPLEVPPEIISYDMPIMIAVTIVMSIFAATGSRLTRAEGAVLLLGYGAYLATLTP